MANRLEYKTKRCRGGHYISEEAAEHIRQHKYSGSDEGISYVWCWNPIATYLVTLLPETLAPNTITLVGFLNALAAPIIMFSMFGCQLVGDLP